MTDVGAEGLVGFGEVIVVVVGGWEWVGRMGAAGVVLEVDSG